MTAPTDKPRVLVVDDNKDAATTLGILLESAGYEVHTCFDGKSALQEAARFAPDACVLDINMPGMDGYELAKRLREKDPEHPPVLATVTAYEDYNHLTKAAGVGFDLHFTKPAVAAEVAEQIGEEVRKHAAEREVKARPEAATDVAVVPNVRPEPTPATREGRTNPWLVPAGVAVAAIIGLSLLIRQIV